MGFTKDMVRIVDAVGYAYSHPTRSPQTAIPKIVGWIAVTGGLILIDKFIQGKMLQRKRSTRDRIERIGYRYGKPASPILLTAASYTIGVSLKDRWSRETALRLAATSVLTGVLQTSVKYIIGRARPYMNEGNLSFKPFTHNPGYHSFLSGHAAVSLGISIVMISRIRHAAGDIFFYTLAAVTALSRMYSNAHWVSDVWTGVWLARVCAKLTSERLDQTERRELAICA